MNLENLLEKRIEELEKEKKEYEKIIIALIIAGGILSTSYPIWNIKFWMEFLVNTGILILFAVIVKYLIIDSIRFLKNTIKRKRDFNF